MPEVSAPSRPQNNPLPQKNLPAPSNPAPLTAAAPKSIAASNHPNVVPASATTAVPRNPKTSPNPAISGAGATTAASAQPAPEQPKKPALGEVHLATPKVTSGKRAMNAAVPDPGVILNNDDQPESSADALNASFVGANKQPVAPSAPIPVGGDVKAAKLISSVPPVYPMLARSQHVSGNVQVDALIDATGHVTNMKVVSGPAPLQQAAMDALKQWRYQPATLDGKAVTMHLTVTLQFRPQ
jgi:TonB family protein